MADEQMASMEDRINLHQLMELKAAFDRADEDGSGTIDRKELDAVLTALTSSSVDIDGDGVADVDGGELKSRAEGILAEMELDDGEELDFVACVHVHHSLVADIKRTKAETPVPAAVPAAQPSPPAAGRSLKRRGFGTVKRKQAEAVAGKNESAACAVM